MRGSREEGKRGRAHDRKKGRDEEGKRTQDTNLSLALPQGIVVSGFKFVRHF
jgi:hypothetical protein